MTEKTVENSSISFDLELFQPEPNTLYSLDNTAYLSGISRRSLLIYCRKGLIKPVFLPPNGTMGFTDQAIYTIRRIEYLRAIHENDLAWINTVFELIGEVERLRAEVRFLRNA